jgi:hypothetical protein
MRVVRWSLRNDYQYVHSSSNRSYSYSAVRTYADNWVPVARDIQVPMVQALLGKGAAAGMASKTLPTNQQQESVARVASWW